MKLILTILFFSASCVNAFSQQEMSPTILWKGYRWPHHYTSYGILPSPFVEYRDTAIAFPEGSVLKQSQIDSLSNKCDLPQGLTVVCRDCKPKYMAVWDGEKFIKIQ